MKKVAAALMIMVIALAPFAIVALGERYGDYLVGIDIYIEDYMVIGYADNEIELHLSAEINSKVVS